MPTPILSRVVIARFYADHSVEEVPLCAETVHGERWVEACYGGGRDGVIEAYAGSSPESPVGVKRRIEACDLPGEPEHRLDVPDAGPE